MSSKEYFNDVANAWDDMRRSFFPDSIRDHAIETAGVTDGLLAADIGAGSGFVTEALLRKGARVIAVDQAEAMVALLRNKFGGVDARQGEAESLPIEDHSVDAAFANMYLHHVEHPDIAIKEMARIIKPGGRLVITDLDTHTFDWLRTEHHDRWMGFERDQIKQWLEAAGLHNVTVDCADADCCATSASGEQSAEISVFMAVGTVAG